METLKMKYCKDTTCNHELAQKHPHCLQEISSYMKKEGGKGNLFVKQELCINIDEVERKSPNANKEATMDMSIIPNYIFLFPTKCKNEARAHFNRIFKGKKVSCTILDEEEFYNLLFE